MTTTQTADTDVEDCRACDNIGAIYDPATDTDESCTACAIIVPSAAPEPCDQCSGKGWVRIAGHNTGAVCGYETVTECMACNPDGAIPWRGQVRL